MSSRLVRSDDQTPKPLVQGEFVLQFYSPDGGAGFAVADDDEPAWDVVSSVRHARQLLVDGVATSVTVLQVAGTVEIVAPRGR